MDIAHLYLGRAGQLAVMPELLARGLNVAIPEVDTGDDLFVVRDAEETVTRVQVKTASGQSKRDGYFAQFHLSLRQLLESSLARMAFVLVVRIEEHWSDFIIISSSALNQLRKQYDVGSLSDEDDLILRLAFTTNNVLCKGASFQSFRNAWEPWPPPP